MNENGQPVGKFMKFLQFPLTRIILGFAFLIIIPSLIQVGAQAMLGTEATLADSPIALLVAVAALLTYYGFVRIVERRAVSELSLPHLLKEFSGGALLGALLFSVTIAILWALGYYQVTGVNPWRVVTVWFITGVISGVFEELLMRGILFRIIEESLGTWIGLIVSALVFGALHLSNPNASLWAGFAIAIEAGILLAATYVFTRRLWLPIGIHLAWNFVQGGIFGVAVSGIESNGWLQAILNGPLLLSGGEFGAEASIFAVFVCLAAGAFFVWKSYSQGKFIKPFWARA
ncbi:MAG: hypothetical protein MHPDNHAH_00360 [Anaerolineales bacterium]|nr:hypothetical protein [Anaerolineales bacterium]